MRPFKYSNASDSVTAIGIVSADPTAKYLGGGTNLVDLMKEDVMKRREMACLLVLRLPIPSRQTTN
jgi:xanthine dehydrogenase YagS FAD-binding subunit